MDMNFYQEQAKKTAIYRGQGEFMGLVYTTLGLNGEAGEFAEKVKKIWRDTAGLEAISDETLQQLKKELGDVLWYLANAADELGLTLEEVASHNLEKLQARVKAGTVKGSGDNR